MLLAEKLLTQEELDKALEEQKKSEFRLGQYLVRAGLVSEGQLVDVLARQLKVEKYSSGQYPLDADLAKLVSLELARKYHLAPLCKKGHLLTIAMVDPMDINALDTMELIANVEVEAVVCTEQQLNSLINSLYGMYSDLGGVIDSVGGGVEIFESSIDDAAEDISAASLQAHAEEVPVVRIVNSILSQAVQDGASDIHISPEKKYIHLQFRVDGKLHDVPAPAKKMFLALVSRIKILANMDIASSRIPQDGRFTIRVDQKEINIRASTMPTIYGENMVLRLLDMSGGLFQLDALGMSENDMIKIRSMINKPYGMILSTGPTGSGKSSSLYSILREVYRPELNIITLEDPVEYRMEKIRQVQLNRRAGMTFASGLRSVLRQDPDVIMVGEIRDAETAEIAVQAALTGHLVLSTIHTNDATGAITRLVEMGVEPFLVSSVLLVAFAQRLVRKVCPDCREPYSPTSVEQEFWKIDPQSIDLVIGRGCFQCKDSGYRGRTGIFETLVVDEEVQDMIMASRSAQEIARAMHAAGRLSTLKEDALDKVTRGITSMQEASLAVM